jgi:gliding motility-associated-like protein
MRIFDRWGELIFESNELYGAWDGKSGGEPVPDGVYAYQFRLHSISGRTAEYQGHVTLLR